MALQIKVSGGTPLSGKSLCATCKHASTVIGQNCEEVVLCHLFGDGGQGRVPFRVATCSRYHPSNVAWLHEMEQMAWIVQAKKRGPVGFDSPQTGEIMEVVVTKPKNGGYTPSPDVGE